MTSTKQNWFATLNEALAAGGVLHKVPMITVNVPRGGCLNICHDGIYITVYRDERGMYEKAISYATKMQDSYVRCEF